MADQFNFAVPGSAKAHAERPGRGLVVALALVLLLQFAALGLLVWARWGTAPPSGAPLRLGVDAQRELALKLEKQGLTESAVAAWQAYLAAKGDDAGKAAEIWYRIGTLWQDAGSHEKALAAYYTSESFGKLPNLEAELGRRVQECLGTLGRFAALRYELKDRTAVGGDAQAGSAVVAEIGPRRITLADLDRLIEERVSAQLERFGGNLTPEQREQRRGEMMKQLGDNRVRRQILAQYLAEEVLCRKARDERLTDQPEVRARLQELERSALASELMSRDLAAKVTITPGDVKTFYEAGKDQFTLPERARIAHIRVADEEKAKALVASLAEGQSFDELARTLGQEAPGSAKNGELGGFVVCGRDDAPGLGRIEGLSAAVFATAAGGVVQRPLKSASGWHVVRVLERLPETIPPFADVQDQAAERLRAQKEREVQEALIKELYQEYDVVVHQQVLGPAPDEAAGPAASQGAPAAAGAAPAKP